jgi:hypothetical protein
MSWNLAGNEALIKTVAEAIVRENEGKICVFRRQIYDWLEDYTRDVGLVFSDDEAAKIVERILIKK